MRAFIKDFGLGDIKMKPVEKKIGQALFFIPIQIPNAMSKIKKPCPK